MGIEQKTITIVTCDICGNQCGKDDGAISIQVNGGDGRDVGPATIDGELRFTQPYGVSNGIICRACKVKWLRQYIEQQSKGEDA